MTSSWLILAHPDVNRSLIFAIWPSSKDSKIIVHVLSKYEAYDKLHERLIIGLINNEFFVMLRTEKGLNILDENFKFNKAKRKFEFVREEIAIDDWEEWNVSVRHEKPRLQLYIA